MNEIGQLEKVQLILLQGIMNSAKTSSESFSSKQEKEEQPQLDFIKLTHTKVD